MYQFICKFCGVKFSSKKKKQNYCSTDCYYSSLENSIPWNKGINDITVICKNCGRVFVLPENQARKRKFCSCKCYSSSRIGIKRSESSKKKISKSMMGNKGREGMSLSEEHKRKIGKANKGRIVTKECRELLSKKTTERYINGKFTWNTGVFFSKKNNKNVFYRSSYELRAYEILENDEDVIKYEVEPFSIEYLWKNIVRNYIPDLLVYLSNGDKKIIEIKAGWALKKDKRVQKKIDACRLFCKNNNYIFDVWTEGHLGL